MEIRRNRLLQDLSKIYLTQSGRKKLPDEDFFYTQNHKSIWKFFSNFLDERFAEEDLSEILTRIKTAPTIPPMLQFEPQTPGEVESEEAKRARTRGQSLADKSYAGREAQYFDGIKKLAAKFNRATVLVLKHTDALITSVPQLGPDQAPRPRNQVSQASSVLQQTMWTSLIARRRQDQIGSHQHARR